jgi:mRNA-degrading endonuclease toxin of MazEF toxin-antitoxin module
MRRGEVYWADLPLGYGRRPVVILTRGAVADVRTRVTVAPVTRRTRRIGSEVPVGRTEGLGRGSVVNVDNVLTVPKELLEPERIGRLGEAATRRLDAALRWALEIRH